MNRESIEIINKHIRPDGDLIVKVKETAGGSKKRISIWEPCIAACFVALLVSGIVVLNSENQVPTQAAEHTTNVDGNYVYSDLVDINTPADESLSGYDMSSYINKICFNEELLVYSDCSAIVEAVIKDVRLKEYVIVTECDKFDKNGILTEKVNSLVCELEITKVWYGDIKENQTVTVETQLFSFDESICIKEGHRYILPLYDEGDEISGFASSGPIISGELTRETNLAIIYAMQPQIESVDGGYVFNSLWESLVCDECIKVEMDMELGEEAEFYRDKMLYLPEKIFNERFQTVVDKLSAN